jgi:hypothetical protein
MEQTHIHCHTPRHAHNISCQLHVLPVFELTKANAKGLSLSLSLSVSKFYDTVMYMENPDYFGLQSDFPNGMSLCFRR